MIFRGIHYVKTIKIQGAELFPDKGGEGKTKNKGSPCYGRKARNI